jgi:hypothetical protein
VRVEHAVVHQHPQKRLFSNTEDLDGNGGNQDVTVKHKVDQALVVRPSKTARVANEEHRTTNDNTRRLTGSRMARRYLALLTQHEEDNELDIDLKITVHERLIASNNLLRKLLDLTDQENAQLSLSGGIVAHATNLVAAYQRIEELGGQYQAAENRVKTADVRIGELTNELRTAEKGRQALQDWKSCFLG